MPRDMTDEDWKKRLLVLVLIEDSGHDHRGPTENEINEAMPRYLREMTRLGIAYPHFYPNVVTDRYPEVHDAIVFGISNDAYAPAMTSGRIRMHGNHYRLIHRSMYLTANEARSAEAAARIAVRKSRGGKSVDDIDDDSKAAS